MDAKKLFNKKYGISVEHSWSAYNGSDMVRFAKEYAESQLTDNDIESQSTDNNMKASNNDNNTEKYVIAENRIQEMANEYLKGIKGIAFGGDENVKQDFINGIDAGIKEINNNQ